MNKLLKVRPLTILLVASFVFSISCSVLQAFEPLPLWPEGLPASTAGDGNFMPTITIHKAPADTNTGAAVVICPGGGYGAVMLSYEGHDVAKWLNTFGVTGIVLDYRHHGRGFSHPAPLQDAQRAIRMVRAQAKELDIRPDRIGIMGFSAGGHLASTAGTHFDQGDPQASDPIERVSCRPDFMILCYAVIALGEPYTHRGSQVNLLGADASDELIREFSSEKQVTKETPPTFLLHTDEDTLVPAENSVQFYLACRRHQVPAELHIYAKGHHGIGLAQRVEGANTWPESCRKWMKNLGLLEK